MERYGAKKQKKDGKLRSLKSQKKFGAEKRAEQPKLVNIKRS